VSLHNGIRAFVLSGGDRCKMLIPAWATTYNVSEEAVRLAWESIMTEYSQQPSNKYEEPPCK
jgi:hypothetical protein